MYENIKRVTEVCSTGEVNRLLSEGWKLLDIYHAERDNCKWRDYIMGKAEPDAAQCAIDEINRRTKEMPRSPTLADADEAEPSLDRKARFVKALWDASIEARKSPEWRKHTSGAFFSEALQCERAARSVTVEDIMNAIGASDMEIDNKMRGHIPFTAPEAITIHDKFFPDVPIAALFGDGKQQRKALAESKQAANKKEA